MSGSFRLSSLERIEVVKWYAILDLVQKFDKTGSVQDSPGSGRSRFVSTDENKECVLAAFQENPETSTRRAALELNLSQSSRRRMMKELGLKPYRPQLLHALNEDDPERRCEFAEKFLNLIDADSSFLSRIVWTDEAIFKLNGHVNRHNCVYYAIENPHIVITEEMNAPGVTVWAGIWVGGIIEPFFFRDNITADSYLETLQENIVPDIAREMHLDETFYMHDGAPAHHAQSIRQFLDDTFPNRWISRRG
ncbi:unnamed protein product [Rotaria sp. Silwood2]|nr:unnamed protein product [Rotaria sp. Silwood2]CAF3174848.1 unnamed protein product [Rotaria sp. Silwood2]CAF4267357.1 unnamed protein product [Rotaria sp. Silwood2]CAF4531543.1 unnamed protein product [Rotaria sp. Silwood2]